MGQAEPVHSRRRATAFRESDRVGAWAEATDVLREHTSARHVEQLERRGPGSLWRFRALDSDFTAELAVDGNGLVLDYPGIARRVL